MNIFDRKFKTESIFDHINFLWRCLRYFNAIYALLREFSTRGYCTSLSLKLALKEFKVVLDWLPVDQVIGWKVYARVQWFSLNITTVHTSEINILLFRRQ